MLFAGYLIRLRLDREFADPRFIQLYLQAADIRRHLERLAKSTSGVNNINSMRLGGSSSSARDLRNARFVSCVL
jgi:type I restriction enzyme S subunit